MSLCVLTDHLKYCGVNINVLDIIYPHNYHSLLLNTYSAAHWKVLNQIFIFFISWNVCVIQITVGNTQILATEWKYLNDSKHETYLTDDNQSYHKKI